MFASLACHYATNGSTLQTPLACLLTIRSTTFQILLLVVLTKSAVSCLTTFLPLSRPFSGACLWLLFLSLSEWCSQKRQFHVSPLSFLFPAPSLVPVYGFFFYPFPSGAHKIGNFMSHHCVSLFTPRSQPVSSSLRSYVSTAVPSLSRHQSW